VFVSGIALSIDGYREGGANASGRTGRFEALDDNARARRRIFQVDALGG
jgi:hypothetical protein